MSFSLRRVLILTPALVMITAAAQANMGWVPGLEWYGPYFGMVIVLDLWVEYIVLRRVFLISKKAVLKVDLGMNFVSCLIGAVLLSIFPPFSVNIGPPEHPISDEMAIFLAWLLLFIIPVLLNTWIEARVITHYFKLDMERRQWKGLLIANVISIAIAFPVQAFLLF